MEFKQIQTLIKNFEKSNMTILEIETEEIKIRLSKNSADQLVIQHPVVETTKKEEENIVSTPANWYEVKSPLVGTFYQASSPKAEPYVKVGERVEKGQTICIIEAMKIMNEITAPVSGVVEKINIKNGDPVGYDQVLMVIDCE